MTEIEILPAEDRRSSSRRTMLVKSTAGIVSGLLGFWYLAVLVGKQWLQRYDDELILRADDYFWRWRLDFRLPLRFLLAGILLTVLVRPTLLRRLRGVPGELAAAGFMMLLTLLAVYDVFEWWGDGWPAQLLNVGSLVLGCYVLWRVESRAQLLARITSRAGSLVRGRWGPYLLAGLCFLVLLFACHLLYGFEPLIVDAQSQVAQARMLLAGQWVIPMSQELRDVIQFPNGTKSVPLYSQYPPGHILLLMPFVAAGISANFACVLAGAALVIVTYKLGQLLGGRRVGAMASILLISSPWFWLMNSSAMNHGTVVLELAWAAYLILTVWLRPGTKPPMVNLFAAGLLLALACITRPLTGAVHVAVWGAAWLVLLSGKRSKVHRTAPGFAQWAKLWPIALGLGSLLPITGLLYYNIQTTGHPLRLQYTTADPEYHQLGFYQTSRVILTPMLAAHHTFSNLISLNDVLLGWPTGALVLLLAWFWRSRLALAEMLFVCLAVAQITAYHFYHFFQLFIGPRFWYELLPFFCLLISIPLTRAALLLPKRLRGLAVLTWIAITMCSAVYTYRRMAPLLHINLARHLRAFVAEHSPYKDPTVIVTPLAYMDLMGPLMSIDSAGQLRPLFVLDRDEQKARALPEFRNHRWLKLGEPPPPKDPGGGMKMSI